MRPEHIATYLDTAAKQAAADIVDGDDPHTIAIDLIAACERAVIELRAQAGVGPSRATQSPVSWTLWLLSAILGVGAASGQATTGDVPAAVVTAGLTGLFTLAHLATLRRRP